MTDHLEEARVRIAESRVQAQLRNLTTAVVALSLAVDYLVDAIAERLPAPPPPPVQVDTEQPARKPMCRFDNFHPVGCDCSAGTDNVFGPRRVKCLGPDERGRKWRDREGTSWSWLDGRWLSEYLDGGFVGGWTTVPADRGPFTEVVE